MTVRAPISIADLVVASVELEAGTETIEAMRRLLQLDAMGLAPTARSMGAHKSTATDTQRPAPDIPRVMSAEPRPEGSGPTPGPATDNTSTTASLTRSATPSAAPAQVVTATPLDLSGNVDQAPLLESLFAPRQARAIVAAAVATRREGSEIDVRRLLADITRRRPVRRVPKLPVASLALGCQILADFSPAMEPFADDRQDLIRTLQATVGTPRVSLHAFRGSPVRDKGASGRSWRPPHGGTPIVVISDLGIGGPPLDRHRSRREDWIEVARQARRRRCPVVAFVPFGPKRWDAGLARLITHVHWDRPMSVGIVRRAIGRGHFFA